ncbi:MAG: glycosyltransferase [Candidatus Nomurabacteria bacterium]|jgi:glycosyltransferase involved in cell wall biosynthesis|nr:glycosyltransferase [Candidatus Nomurabacteria bacterium]
MPKTKVLMVANWSGSGGTEMYLLGLYKHIDHSRFDVQFLINYYTDDGKPAVQELRKLGATIHKITFSLSHPKSWPNFGKVRQLLKREHYDIVHIHSHYCEPIELMARHYGAKVVVHTHMSGWTGRNSLYTNIKRFGYAAPARFIENRMDARLACSKRAGEFRFRRPNFQLAYNGVEVQAFRYQAAMRHKFRKQLGLADSTTAVLHVGRFAAVKNHPMVVRVFAAYHQIHPDSHLILVGSGPLEAEVRREIAQHNLQAATTIITDMYNVADFYNAADILLLPSIAEGLGIVLVEAQLNGLPCLASDTTPKSVFYNSNTEQLPLSASPNTWSKHLVELAKIGRITPSLQLLQDYDAAHTAEQLEDFYDNLLKSPTK